jgi:hypothetical protein
MDDHVRVHRTILLFALSRLTILHQSQDRRVNAKNLRGTYSWQTPICSAPHSTESDGRVFDPGATAPATLEVEFRGAAR